MAEPDHRPELDETSSARFVRGSVLLLGGRLLSIVIKTVTQIVIIRYLTKTEYGAFSYTLTLVDIGVIVPLLALDHAASRFVPLYTDRRDDRRLAGFIVLSVVTIVGLGLAVVAVVAAGRDVIADSLISDSLVAELLVIMVALVPLQAFDAWAQGMFAALERPAAIFLRRYVLLPGLQLLTVFVVIAFDEGPQWLAWGYLLGGIVGTVAYASMLVRLLRERGIWSDLPWRDPRVDAREIFGFSLPTFFAVAVFIVRSHVAVVLLGLFKGTAAVAEYRAVDPVVRLNGIANQSVRLLYLPLAVRTRAADETALSALYWRTTAWTALMTFPIFLVTFSLADPVVSLVLGSDFDDSGPIMALLAVGAYVNAAMGLNKETLRAHDEVRFLAVVDLFVMGVALGLYLPLIPAFGATGAAVATTAAIVVGNVCTHAGLVRRTSVEWFDRSQLGLYAAIVVGAGSLAVVQWVWSPSLALTLPLALAGSLWLLSAHAGRLEVGTIFPELLRVPVLGRLIR